MKYYWKIKRWCYNNLGFDSLSTFMYWLRTPSNKLTIRNIPRSWCDRDNRLFHACFTILCDFIEKEYGHEWKEYVDWCIKGQSHNYTLPDYIPKHQRDAAIIFDQLYTWYNTIDWNDPVPCPQIEWYTKEQEFEKLRDRNLELLMKHRNQLWT